MPRLSPMPRISATDSVPQEISAIVSEVGDAADDLSTGAVMSVGDRFLGSLQSTGDKDWVAIELNAGESYVFDLKARSNNGVSDTYLRLYDSAGNLLKEDDDGGAGLNSKMTLTASYTGTYYIEADSYRSNKTGDYQIEVEITQPPNPLDSLIWGGAKLDDSQVISVYFALEGTPVNDDGNTLISDGFTQVEIDTIMGMFSDISTFADITFARTTVQNGANLSLALDNLGGSTLGYMYPIGTSSSDGLGVFTSNPTYWNPASIAKGGFMYSVVVHELGHGLGLAHPHDRGGGSDIMEGVNTSGDTGEFGELNQTIFTIMSYNDSWNGHPMGLPDDYSAGYMATYGALDIAVLQQYYGANTSQNAGNTTYSLGVEGYYQTIWDAGGRDRIVVAGSADAVVDLRAASLNYEVGGGGYVSYSVGVRGGFTIANGVVIEKAVGNRGDDTLTGNAANNQLKGRQGGDTLAGQDGNDRLKGGGGNDTLVGGAGRDLLVGGNGRDQLNGGEGADIFRFDLNDGSDSLAGFSEEDRIDLSGLGLTYAGLDLSVNGSTATLRFGTTEVTFTELTADLDATDFIF